MIKVLIADDQELIRQSLQIVLNSKADIEVCDVAADGQEVIRSIRKEKPGYSAPRSLKKTIRRSRLLF